MANSTLRNLKDSAFVRTDPVLATRIGRTLLQLPSTPFSVWDPTCGTGSLFFACAHTPWARLFGTEISGERAEEARSDWPCATIVTAAFEAVSLQGMVDLLLVNPPYLLQDGKRASLRIIADAGEHLQPGGVLVAILAARSDWDGHMINHWLKYYEQIRVRKFPDRTSKEQEGVFEDYTQIVVVGVRRSTPVDPTAAEKKRLQGYQWKNPEQSGQSGWHYGVAPSEIPEIPIVDPYRVPSSHQIPRLVVRNADEATLLYALNTSGAHFSPAWQQATTWPEAGYLDAPAMPYTGEAHIAAEVMIGGLDGEIVFGPGTGEDAEPHLFTAFVGQEWIARPVEDEIKEKLSQEGCIRVEMKQLEDKPILGVLNLIRGTTHYYQGEDVFTFLQPWLPTLASRVIKKRKPLYQLDPADWEIRVLSQFGIDKQLPKAVYAGLAVPQMHRVFAMGRSLDARGRTAIQGEPGTGKTRLATATAARQAYRWRYRNTEEFRQSEQPTWIKNLRRAWLKNSRTLAMLELEPVYGRHVKDAKGGKGKVVHDPTSRQIVAYRELATGNLITPEDAGPKALPVLITTPLKVTKEYGKEITAAYPQAEVIHIESHRDVQRWLEQCATSSAPVVFGMFSHSTTRAFGREWKPAVREKVHLTHVPELDPDPSLRDTLEVVRDERKHKLVGYRVKATGKLLTKQVKVTHFYCVDCGARIDATPGRFHQPDEDEGEKKPLLEAGRSAQEKEGVKTKEPVTSRTWFTTKQRWCSCQSRQNQDRVSAGKQPLRSALWQDDRTKATNRKHPPCSFVQWSQAVTVLQEQAERMQAHTSTRELAQSVRCDEALLSHLVEVAMHDQDARAALLPLVERVEPIVTGLRTQVRENMGQLATILLDVAPRDEWVERLLERVAQGDPHWLKDALAGIVNGESDVQRLVEAIHDAEQQIAAIVQQVALHDSSQTMLSRLVEATKHLVDWQPVFFRLAYEHAHTQSQSAASKTKRTSGDPLGADLWTRASMHQPQARTRLVVVEEGPLSWQERDRSAARGYDVVKDLSGKITAYQMGHQGHRLVPLQSQTSGRITGYRDATTGEEVMAKTSYDFRTPPADSFSPYQYLYRFFKGCVALAVVDESHNGRGRDTDIARSHHFAMLAAQTRQLTSGTHYGGDVLGFYHYWYRYNPAFWRRFGFGWKDAEKALTHYGVVQQWTKEYESDARRGSGQTDVRVSTIPAPGLSAKLIPGLLEDLTYLTVLDVGAHMPPKKEIPKGISMTDPTLEQAVKEAEVVCREAMKEVAATQKAYQEAKRQASSEDQQVQLASLQGQCLLVEDRLKQVQNHLTEVRQWADKRDLSRAYGGVARQLEELARQGNAAARLAQGTIPRWFAALPCDSAYEVYQTSRDDWGDKGEPELVIKTPVLEWNYLYPMEHWLIQTVTSELSEGRRSMIYFEQNAVRSMAKRLQWVLSSFKPWTLPNGVEAEDRQQAIIDAVEAGQHVVIVPYRRVNEGLNLQKVIDTIIWYEQSMNLFMYLQASQRAWRLGKQEEVRIYLPFYFGTAAHTKMRKLGGQSGAAAAFAGEPAKGELIKHVGADQTTLARLSASLEDGTRFDDPDPVQIHDDLAQIEAAFARRNDELAEALKHGRQWFGVEDTLAERLATVMEGGSPDVWAVVPPRVYLPDEEVIVVQARPVEAAESPMQEIRQPVAEMPAEPQGVEETAQAPEPVEPVASTVPQIPDAVAAQPIVLVFGDEEAIKRARKRREGRQRRAFPRLKHPVTVKDIPAEPVSAAPSKTTQPETEIVVSSLWEMSFSNEDETHVA